MTRQPDVESIIYGLDEDEESHIILTDKIGEGEVQVGWEFQELPSLQQADLLQDWIRKLNEMYESVTDGTFLSDMGRGPLNDIPEGDLH